MNMQENVQFSVWMAVLIVFVQVSSNQFHRKIHCLWFHREVMTMHPIEHLHLFLITILQRMKKNVELKKLEWYAFDARSLKIHLLYLKYSTLPWINKMDTMEFHCKLTKIIHPHHNRWTVIVRSAFRTAALQKTTSRRADYIFDPEWCKTKRIKQTMQMNWMNQMN